MKTPIQNVVHQGLVCCRHIVITLLHRKALHLYHQECWIECVVHVPSQHGSAHRHPCHPMWFDTCVTQHYTRCHQYLEVAQPTSWCYHSAHTCLIWCICNNNANDTIFLHRLSHNKQGCRRVSRSTMPSISQIGIPLLRPHFWWPQGTEWGGTYKLYSHQSVEWHL